MKLLSISVDGKSELAIIHENQVYPTSWFNLPSSLEQILKAQSFDKLTAIEQFEEQQGLPIDDVQLVSLNTPQLVVGVGLNYREHAADLDAHSPSSHPVIFFKTPNTYTHQGKSIKIPKLSHRTTGEAEIGLMVKKYCSNIKAEDWLQYTAGYISIIDMTAEDLLRANTRYLSMSKVFDTFLSMGSELITPDELVLPEIRVTTVLNGEEKRSNTVSNMMFSPPKLLEFISSVLPLQAGDVISTGTPGAVHLRAGDTICSRIDGFRDLSNTVVDLKSL